MTVIVRTASPQDAPALIQCIDRAYAQHKADLPDLPDVSGGILQDITDHHVVVAEVNGELVAGAILMINETTALLANIGVDPTHGGKGIARRLIAQIEQTAKTSGCTELRLSTHEKMPDNIALYEHLGWSIKEQSGSKIHMTKPL